MNEYDQIEEFLRVGAPKVYKKARIVSRDMMDSKYLVHLSSDTDIKSFKPEVSRRTMNIEDRTMARISGSPTILGAMLAYMADLQDFFLNVNKHNKKWRGGWIIYGIPFRYAVRPNASLLPDVHSSNEHWVVGYNEKHQRVVPAQMGKIFYRDVKFTSNQKNYTDEGYFTVEVNVYIEINKGFEVKWSEEVTLGEGYHRIVIHDWAKYMKQRWKSGEDYTHYSISKRAYQDAKKLSAGMLDGQPTW